MYVHMYIYIYVKDRCHYHPWKRNTDIHLNLNTQELWLGTNKSLLLIPRPNSLLTEFVPCITPSMYEQELWLGKNKIEAVGDLSRLAQTLRRLDIQSNR